MKCVVKLNLTMELTCKILYFYQNNHHIINYKIINDELWIKGIDLMKPLGVTDRAIQLQIAQLPPHWFTEIQLRLDLNGKKAQNNHQIQWTLNVRC